MKTIRAAVCQTHQAPLDVMEVGLLPPRAGEVEVTLEACAICHSDISYADGSWGGTVPIVLGHEGVGRISALGAGVTDHTIGQRVLVTLMWACGTCARCRAGAPVHCLKKWTRDDPGPLRLLDGGPLAQGIACGAFAEACVVHQSQIHPVPETIPPEAACLLSCGVITGVGSAVNTAQIRPGQTVVVIGAGGVGLNAIQGARIAGAARVVAVDMTETKLTEALALGATDGILATDPKPWDRLTEIAPQGADVVIVSVGAVPAFEAAPNYLTNGGKIVLVGMPHLGAEARYDPLNIAFCGHCLVGSPVGDTVLARDIPWMIDLYGQGRLKLDELVSGRWSLDQINAAIDSTRSGTARRNVILF